MTHLTTSASKAPAKGEKSRDSAAITAGAIDDGSDQDLSVQDEKKVVVSRTIDHKPITSQNGTEENGVKKVRKFAGESFEEASLWDAFCTYLCYAVLVIVGYVNDFIRPRTTLEKNREVYNFYFSTNNTW